MTRRVLFGSYELIERIGEGGMAEVWRARSRGAAGFQKTVVIKRVLPSLMARPDFADLLVREAKIASRLNHPNIVQIFDLGEEQEAYFIAMEYVHGRDLASAIAYRPNPSDCVTDGLSLPLRLFIACEAARALDYAHRRRADDGRPLGIVHRDVSPQNILLGYEGQVKVGDFGIAMADEHGLGRDEDPSVLRGKYAYMSPEQARGEPLDNRSDLFSLGIVTWEMVTGERLFRAASRTQTLERVRQALIPQRNLATYGASAKLRAILERALAVDRDARYPTVGDMLDELSKELVSMGQHVDESHLATALKQMFPPDDRGGVNKLRVDLHRRVEEDATGIGMPMMSTTPHAENDDRTRALPLSRRMRFDDRPVVALHLLGSLDAERFQAIVRDLRGMPLPTEDGGAEALFGVTGHPQEAAELAARAALRLRDVAGAGARMLILRSNARVYDAGFAETAPEERTRALALLHGLHGGEVACEGDVAADLDWVFRMGQEALPRVHGLRSRSEREAETLRRDAPFVGRRDTLKLVGEALASVVGGHGSALLFIGAAGVGKSRVLAEVRSLTQGEGRSFVNARCHGALRSKSFSVLAELLVDLAGIEEDDTTEQRAEKVERMRVLGFSPREIVLVSELVGLGAANMPATGARPGRPRGLEIVGALYKALRALAADQPVVLAIEDVHVMDDATRQVMAVLLSKLRSVPVLTVMTARPSPSLPVLPGVERVAVRPLDLAANARLFAAVVGGRNLEHNLSNAVHLATEGVPAWTVALADDMRERGAALVDVQLVHAGDALTITVPERLQLRIASDLAQLSATDRATLQLASLFREPVDVPTLAAVQGFPRDAVEGPVRRLLALHWVVPDVETPDLWPAEGRWGGGGGLLTMPARMRIAGGTLMRDAVRNSLSPHASGTLHGMIASALERGGAAEDERRVAQLAYHAVRAYDPSRAPAYLVRAADLAERDGDLAEAAGYVADAARVVAVQVATAEAVGGRVLQGLSELVIRAADLSLAVGNTARALDVLQRFTPEFRGAIDADVRLALHLSEARVAAHRERWNEVVQILAITEENEAEPLDPDLLGEALMRLGHARLEAGEVEAASRTLALAVAQLSGDDTRLLHGMGSCYLAIALARLGLIDEARSRGTDAMTGAVCVGELRLRWSSLVAMAEVAEAVGDFTGALTRWSDAMGVAREHGMPVELCRSAVRSAAAAFEAGWESRAAVFAEEAIHVGRKHRQDAVVSLASAIQGALAVAAHPDPGFVKGMVRGVESLESMDRPAEAAMALRMLASVHVALGDVPAAIRTLGRARPLAVASGQLPLAARLLRAAERLAEGATDTRGV
jgi:serine/threonine protein kinase